MNLLIKSVTPHCMPFAPVQSVTLDKSNCHADRAGKPSLGIVTKKVGSSAYLNKDISSCSSISKRKGHSGTNWKDMVR